MLLNFRKAHWAQPNKAKGASNRFGQMGALQTGLTIYLCIWRISQKNQKTYASQMLAYHP